jgi:hypothetical protein
MSDSVAAGIIKGTANALDIYNDGLKFDNSGLQIQENNYNIDYQNQLSNLSQQASTVPVDSEQGKRLRVQMLQLSENAKNNIVAFKRLKTTTERAAELTTQSAQKLSQIAGSGGG